MHSPAAARRPRPPPHAAPLLRRVGLALLQNLTSFTAACRFFHGSDHSLRAGFNLHMDSGAGFPVEAGGAHCGAGESTRGREAASTRRVYARRTRRRSRLWR
ncbi:UNVERIFIED_CONTAM: hypothetical protein Sradi_2728300 [Sesamum radiatum]|uniref:Uncharacterized protein n=1 Tax=Sesamum radiatum TaxID=300843 RepID=A0AAW2S7G8_SESRA